MVSWETKVLIILDKVLEPLSWDRIQSLHHFILNIFRKNRFDF